MDSVDRGLVHALQLDGRAPFSKIARVLGVSEQTVARRYRKLRSSGAIRVVGGVDGARLGYTSWTIRLRTTPGAATALGSALARRTDTFYVHLLSGGTEISCFTQAPEDDQAPLLEKLPRTSKVLAISAHSLLHGFAIPGGWAGLACLDQEQAAHLRFSPAPERHVTADPADHALLEALAAAASPALSQTDLAPLAGKLTGVAASLTCGGDDAFNIPRVTCSPAFAARGAPMSPAASSPAVTTRRSAAGCFPGSCPSSGGISPEDGSASMTPRTPRRTRRGRARGAQARWRSSRCRISSSTALGRVVSKSISFAHVGVTTIRTMPSWYSERTSASHSTRCSGVIS